MKKQVAPQSIVTEYKRLRQTMMECINCVDVPFGVAGPVRRRMNEIEARYILPEVR